MSSNTNHASGNKSVAGIAKDALSLIATYRLPPSPLVYDVFFRHCEGRNEQLSEELKYRIDNHLPINTSLVESIHAQHCVASNSEIEERIANRLGEELAGFHSIVSDQKTAGDFYSQKLDSAKQVFASSESAELVDAVESLTNDTKSMQQELAKMQSRVVAADQQVSDLRSELRQAQVAMMTDHLTGLGNRRFYETLLRESVRSAQSSDQGVTPYLVLIDCDKFKKINDSFGHPFGDEVIKILGDELSNVRHEASVARLGGDEFAVFVRFESDEQIEQFVDDVRGSIANRKIVHAESGTKIDRLTLSIGIARVRGNDDETTWHARADKMLYEAKTLGGDRAVLERKLGR